MVGANSERLRPERDFGLRLSFYRTQEISCALRQDRFWTPSSKDPERDFKLRLSFYQTQVPPTSCHLLREDQSQTLFLSQSDTFAKLLY